MTRGAAGIAIVLGERSLSLGGEYDGPEHRRRHPDASGRRRRVEYRTAARCCRPRGLAGRSGAVATPRRDGRPSVRDGRQGLGANHVILLPSGVIAFRFMDEGDMNIDPLVRRVENLRSSCQ
jgi:hypothetical protein